MKATVNGFSLPMVGEVSWTTRPGFEPSVHSFYVAKGVVNQLRASPEDITLILGGRVIKNLILISDGPGVEAAGNEKAFDTITLADKRWLLSTTGADVAFNLRRRTSMSLVDTGTTVDVPPQILTKFNEEEYYPITLNNGEPWAVEDAILELSKRAKFPIQPVPPGFPRGDIFGDKGYRGQGMLSHILSELLGMVPLWEFSITDDGEGFFYRQHDVQGTLDLLKDASKFGTSWGGGIYSGTNRSRYRPREIRVHFYVEAEILFSYFPTLDKQLAFQSAAPIIPGPAPDAYLESYIKNPIDSLPFAGQKIARGSFVNFHAFLQALAEADATGEVPIPIDTKAAIGPVTEELIQKYYNKTNYLFGVYSLERSGQNNPLYLRILGEIFNSYRMFYRLTTQWARSVSTIATERLDFVDPISATRRKTLVFCPFSAALGEREQTVRKRNDFTNHWMLGQLTSTTPADPSDSAPADIFIEDQEGKAMGLIFRRGQFGNVDEYIPAILEGESTYLNTSNLKIEMDKGVPIKPDFFLQTILTCTPIPRHTGTHLFTVSVAPKDAAAKLGLQPTGLGPCLGPVLDIYVPFDPNMTAKFAYSADKIQQELADPFFDPNAKFPESRLTNKVLVDDIATAYAAAYYYRFMDHIVGRMTTVNAGQDTKIKGSIASVTSTATMHTYEAGYEVTAATMMNFLTTSTREFLQRRIK